MGVAFIGDATGRSEEVPAGRLQDVDLLDVVFVDAHHGWAVGDRGAVWHTDDGGRLWRQQRSGIDCRLHAVSFVDAQNGWIVGDYALPFTHRPIGVVLRTIDGGRNWRRIDRLGLPGLGAVRFFDARHGWAAGCASALYPAGVFRTRDAGATWSTVPRGLGRHWSAADFALVADGAIAGALAADRGPVATVGAGGLSAGGGRSQFDSATPRRIRFASERRAWLVGDDGLVLASGDAGRSWQPSPARLPGQASGRFDFHALAVFDEHCWIAGTPGSIVFHSSDGGHAWQAGRTGQTLPLAAVTFIDPNRGWAVGALGTILATGDAGRTWTRQRSAADRLAWLGVFARGEDVPMEILAQTGARDGYRGRVAIVGRSVQSTGGGRSADLVDRLRQAVSTVGVCGADRLSDLPFPPRGAAQSSAALAVDWNRTAGPDAVDRLERRLVRELRVWRPGALIVNSPRVGRDDASAELVRRLVLQAIPNAADRSFAPNQILRDGLEPWSVARVFTTPGDRAEGEPDRLKPGTVKIDTAGLVIPPGRSVADLAATARSFVETKHVPGETEMTLGTLIREPGPTRRSPKDLLAGLDGEQTDRLRRTPSASSSTDLQQWQRSARAQRGVNRLLDQAIGPLGGNNTGGAWLGQLAVLLGDVDSRQAGAVFCRLAYRYEQLGRFDLATETFARIDTQFADDPHAEAARLWLLAHYGSAELSMHKNRKHADSTARAIELARRIQAGDPELALDPRVQFPLAAAYRARLAEQDAEHCFRHSTWSRWHDAWADCAAGERHLANARLPSPKLVWQCGQAARPPKLDGVLDDEAWQSAEPAMLQRHRALPSQWPAGVLAAYDDEHLYLAVRCRCAAGVEYPADDAPRKRDADLSRADRVDLLLDVDRDYATYWRLTVDYNGRTSETCMADRTWDPQWYVAAAMDDGQWTVEAAIAVDQLVRHPPKPNEVWSVGIQRTIPQTEFQSWTQPATPEVLPKGFGHLRFE